MNRRGLAIILFAWIGASAGAGEADGAERLAEAAAKLQPPRLAQPDSAATLFLQGKVAIRRGDYATAMDALERAVALAPRESDYHHWLGNACAWVASGAALSDKPALGKRCLAAYRRALELTGRVALASGERLAEGEAALRRCLELAPAETDESHEAVTRCLGELRALKPGSENVARLK